MPWSVTRSTERCSESEPYAVVNDDSGEVEACHETEEAANRQRDALYANEPQAASGAVEHKNIDVDYKAAHDDGTFVALASVFNNVDRVGDRVMPGAFKKTLRKWRSSGRMLPVILSHQWNDIEAHIGYADPKEVKETGRGLEVKAHLDVDENETARHVHRLMKRGQLTAMSFGYTVGNQKMDDKGVNEVSEIDLHEVGPTLVGANPEAQLQEVKAAIEAEASPNEARECVNPPPTSQDEAAIKDGANEEPNPAKSRPHDPLKQRSMDLVLEISSAGQSRIKPSQPEPEPKPEAPPEGALRKRHRELELELLTD